MFIRSFYFCTPLYVFTSAHPSQCTYLFVQAEAIRSYNARPRAWRPFRRNATRRALVLLCSLIHDDGLALRPPSVMPAFQKLQSSGGQKRQSDVSDPNYSSRKRQAIEDGASSSMALVDKMNGQCWMVQWYAIYMPL